MTERERLEALKLLTDVQWKELRLALGRSNAAQLPEVGVSADRAVELMKLLAARPAWVTIVDDYLVGSGLGPAPWKPWMDGLAEEYGRIPLIGFSAHRDLVQMPANALFLELSLLKEEVDPKGRRIEVEDRKPLSIEDACRRLGTEDWGLAIVGRPGSGKTTLLRRIFTRCSREGGGDVGLPAGLIPVYLRIGSVAPEILALPPARRRGCMKDLVIAGAGLHRSAAEALMKPGRPLLFLLDGLDEVGTDAQRLEICTWLIREIPDWRPNARVILSCRSAAWEQAGPALRSRLQPLEVRDLTLEQATKYVGAWFTSVTPEIAKGRGGGQQALEARLQDPQSRTDHSLLALARTPLLLSIVCLVHHFYGLPERRVDLYQRAVEILLRDHALHQERPECVLSEGELRRLLQVLA
ncbi:MAG TPA: NACHT domain-containing protein, partial [Myxococcota bacterium]|nr:NACHT domain-containing protein [Myxococcota bacterium]